MCSLGCAKISQIHFLQKVKRISEKKNESRTKTSFSFPSPAISHCVKSLLWKKKRKKGDRKKTIKTYYDRPWSPHSKTSMKPTVFLKWGSVCSASSRIHPDCAHRFPPPRCPERAFKSHVPFFLFRKENGTCSTPEEMDRRTNTQQMRCFPGAARSSPPTWSDLWLWICAWAAAARSGWRGLVSKRKVTAAKPRAPRTARPASSSCAHAGGQCGNSLLRGGARGDTHLLCPAQLNQLQVSCTCWKIWISSSSHHSRLLFVVIQSGSRIAKNCTKRY